MEIIGIAGKEKSFSGKDVSEYSRIEASTCFYSGYRQFLAKLPRH